jgi:hypothetical protein
MANAIRALSVGRRETYDRDAMAESEGLFSRTIAGHVPIPPLEWSQE